MKGSSEDRYGLSHKIIRNTIFNSAGRMWSMAVSFLMTPYILHRIGVEDFAIWAVVSVVTGYFGIFDLGIGSSFVKYIAEHHARDDVDSISDVVTSGAIFYSIFALFVTSLILLMTDPIISIFQIPAEHLREARFSLYMGAAAFAISSVFSPFGAVCNGLQRMDIGNKLAIAFSVLNIIGTLFFINGGFGLQGLMVNAAILAVLSGVTNVIVAYRLVPRLRFDPKLCTRNTVNKLFSYGYKIQVVRISGMVGSQTDKMLISHYLNLGTVTFYQLGNTIVDQAKWMCLLLVSALLPTFSELNALKDHAKMKALYLRSMKYLGMITLIVFIFIIINARRLIAAWINEDLSAAALTLQVLTAGFFINTLTGPASVIVQGISRVEYQVRSSLIHIFLGLGLSVALVVKFGLMGALVGTSISVTITSCYFIYLVNNDMRVSFAESFGRMPLAALSCLPGIAANLLVNRMLPIVASDMTRLKSGLILGLNFTTFLSTALVCLIAGGFFDRDDKEIFRKTVRMILRFPRSLR